MPSQSEPWDKGTEIVAVHDGGFERHAAEVRAATQPLVDAGYMCLASAPSAFTTDWGPLWGLHRRYPVEEPAEFRNTWMPRWLVYSHYECRQQNAIESLMSLVQRPLGEQPCGADAFHPSGKRAETVEDRVKEIQDWLETNGLYREATD